MKLIDFLQLFVIDLIPKFRHTAANYYTKLSISYFFGQLLALRRIESRQMAPHLGFNVRTDRPRYQQPRVAMLTIYLHADINITKQQKKGGGASQ